MFGIIGAIIRGMLLKRENLNNQFTKNEIMENYGKLLKIMRKV